MAASNRRQCALILEVVAAFLFCPEFKMKRLQNLTAVILFLALTLLQYCTGQSCVMVTANDKKIPDGATSILSTGSSITDCETDCLAETEADCSFTQLLSGGVCVAAGPGITLGDASGSVSSEKVCSTNASTQSPCVEKTEASGEIGDTVQFFICTPPYTGNPSPTITISRPGVSSDLIVPNGTMTEGWYWQIDSMGADSFFSIFFLVQSDADFTSYTIAYLDEHQHIGSSTITLSGLGNQCVETTESQAAVGDTIHFYICRPPSSLTNYAIIGSGDDQFHLHKGSWSNGWFWEELNAGSSSAYFHLARNVTSVSDFGVTQVVVLVEDSEVAHVVELTLTDEVSVEPNPEDDESEMSVYVWVGIGVAGLLVIVFVVVAVCRCRRNKAEDVGKASAGDRMQAMSSREDSVDAPYLIPLGGYVNEVSAEYASPEDLDTELATIEPDLQGETVQHYETVPEPRAVLEPERINDTQYVIADDGIVAPASQSTQVTDRSSGYVDMDARRVIPASQSTQVTGRSSGYVNTGCGRVGPASQSTQVTSRSSGYAIADGGNPCEDATSGQSIGPAYSAARELTPGHPTAPVAIAEPRLASDSGAGERLYDRITAGDTELPHAYQALNVVDHVNVTGGDGRDDPSSHVNTERTSYAV